MSQLDTLGVASGSRGVAENVHIFLCWLNERSVFTGLSLFAYLIESSHFDSNLLGLLQESWLHVIEDDESLDGLSHASLLHIDELLGVVLAAHDCLHLSLSQDEVDLLAGHGIIEADSGDIVVHACNECGGPLPSVLGPDTKESPLLALALSLRAQVQLHHTLSELLSDDVDFIVGSPCVVTELRLTIGVLLWQLLSRAKEWLVSTARAITLEDL